MKLADFPTQNRPDRAIIAIAGDSALSWINNLVTCDASGLAAGAAAYGALLTPQGKILHELFILHAGERLLVDCVTDQRAALLQKLATYRLRAKLQIELDNDLEVGVVMEKPETPHAFADPRQAEMGWRCLVPAGSLINAPGSKAYDARRIALGLADGALDIGMENVFPHEANFDQFGGVSFSKGCYIGQEVVSRMQHRGTARSRMLPVRFAGTMASGSEILSGEKVIGQVLSAVTGSGLALLRLDRLAEAKEPLMAGGVRVHVETPEWITYDVAIPEVAQ
jgi:folate-binding protein YgfZ